MNFYWKAEEMEVGKKALDKILQNIKSLNEELLNGCVNYSNVMQDSVQERSTKMVNNILKVIDEINLLIQKNNDKIEEVAKIIIDTRGE